MNIEVLLDKLLKAVQFKFGQDPTGPGVITSYLRNGKYYASVVRFTQSFGKGKVVVCKAQADDLLTALTEVAQKFVVIAQQPVDPVHELDVFVSKEVSPALDFTDYSNDINDGDIIWGTH